MSPGVYHLATYMQRMRMATEARAPDRQPLMSTAQQPELAQSTDLRARGVVEAGIDETGTLVSMHLRGGVRGGKQSKPQSWEEAKRRQAPASMLQQETNSCHWYMSGGDLLMTYMASHWNPNEFAQNIKECCL